MNEVLKDRAFACVIALAVFLVAPMVTAQTLPELPKAGEARVVHFQGSSPEISRRSTELQDGFDLAQESFEIFVPNNYSNREPFGLLVFIDSQNEMALPKPWRAAVEERKLITVIPQRIGNDQLSARRMGLATVAILKAMEYYQIDTNRIVMSGFSGGARCALHLSLIQAGLITGSVSICGADFYKPVPMIKATNIKGYGVWPATDETAERAKSKVRFALVTGSDDPRRGNILDIYEGGFAKAGFRSLLIDVPGMGHQLCRPESLGKALDYAAPR